MTCVHNRFSQQHMLSISASRIAAGSLPRTELHAHLESVRFSSESRAETLLNLKKNDNIVWRQCEKKIDFYQEVLLLEDCSVLWLGLFSHALVLILHFQPPRGGTKKRFQAWEEKRVTLWEENGVFCLSFIWVVCVFSWLRPQQPVVCRFAI